MEAEQEILVVHPKAIADRPWYDKNKFYIVILPDTRLSDDFDTEEEAWENALERLKG